ncbi:MAG: hypothetical protein RhofKO_16900 [Rhodothermales bacterium]
MMRFLKAGFDAAMRYKGVALLLFGVHLVLAYVLTQPLYHALDEVVSGTGFSMDLSQGFDLVLWVEIWETFGPAVYGFLGQLWWVVLLIGVWKAVSSVGVLHALYREHGAFFWSGLGQHGGRALSVALLFLLAACVWIGLVLFVGTVIAVAVGTEVGIFWTAFVVMPTLLISGLAVLDLMHDYARAGLVVERWTVGQAFRRGIGWPFRHGMASLLYVAWFVVALLVLALPFLLESWLPAYGKGTAWLRFGLQQGVFLLRAFVTVAWFGTTLAFFEHIQRKNAVLIAETPPPSPESPAMPDDPSLV